MAVSESCRCRGRRLTRFQDLGGQTSIRPYWRCYYGNTAAVIFVVDSTDIDRLPTASEELAAMLNEEELKDAGLLVFANKQDQPGAKGAGEISEALNLGELRDRNWSIVGCSAVDGRGVDEGMDWLVVSASILIPAKGSSTDCHIANCKRKYMTESVHMKRGSALNNISKFWLLNPVDPGCAHTSIAFNKSDSMLPNLSQAWRLPKERA